MTLTTVSIGRVIYTVRALLDIVLANFALHDGVIVLPIGKDSKLFAAVRNMVVAFEVDDFDIRPGLGGA